MFLSVYGKTKVVFVIGIFVIDYLFALGLFVLFILAEQLLGHMPA
jgi:hypothetical protein